MVVVTLQCADCDRTLDVPASDGVWPSIEDMLGVLPEDWNATWVDPCVVSEVTVYCPSHPVDVTIMTQERA